jgi:hypothetical protein
MLKSTSLFALCFWVLHTTCMAQEDSLVKKRVDWSNIGIGTARKDILNGLAGANFSANYNSVIQKSNCYQVGLNTTFFSAYPNLTAYHVGLGKRYANRFLLLAAFFGPAYITGKAREKDRFHTIGISSNVHLILKPLKDLGLGIEFYTNLSFIQSTSGVRLVVHLSSK